MKKLLKPMAIVLVGLVVGVVLPQVLLQSSDWRAVSGAALLAAMSAYLMAFTGGWRVGLCMVVPFAVLSALVVVCAANQWVIALIFGLIAFGRGLAGVKGLMGAMSLIPIMLGFLLGDPPTIQSTVPLWLLVGIVTLVGGAYSIVVAIIALKFMPSMPKAKPLPLSRARTFAIVSGVMVAAAAWSVVHWNLGHPGAWLILTIVVVLQPFVQDGLRKCIERALGTVIGFVIAFALGALIHNTVVLICIGLVTMVLAMAAMFSGRPYWQYATVLTVTVVVIEGASSSVVDLADQRLIATFVGVVACLAVTAAFQPVAKRHATTGEHVHY